MTLSKLPVHHHQLPATDRHLAYSEVGDANATQVLLCLPGLLETRASFDPLLQAAQGVRGLRLISLDLCGRGDSSLLPGDVGYTMQVYLDDAVQFIQQVVMRAGSRVTRLELMGTSMGGILAMYLTKEAGVRIDGLFLNDIGLNLPWMSIYGLYDGMKVDGRLPEPEDMAAQFNVSLGAVHAVQTTSHFDLPYRKDWKGMNFGHLLHHFKGAMRLIHGSDSGVCSPEQVRVMKSEFAQCQVLEVPGAHHPAPFTPEVCAFVLKALSDEPQAVESAAAKERREEKERGFWPWLKQRYRGAKAT
jgi:pimeloyl-ACP methyl ester carboxylesterase